ncbi:hypothetical protein SKC35_06975 [Aquirufa sp. KTFRIE-69F]|uniref:Phage protein n=1 Tax=Aquirufa originis TaxID=3096514 RepID=A0ABW6D8S9_9BACT
MSRVKQNQIIDDAIQSIVTITKSQGSLSEQDLTVLNEASVKLQLLRSKKGRTNKQIRDEIAKSVELLLTFFIKD